ncbi:hypothetical protein Tco_0077815 [Tanacetum coccineum]
MSTLKFAETHNMVTFLSKPTEHEGFEQIIDFLNANPINYALTVNPTIFNGEEQLQALVDRKKETQPSGPTPYMEEEAFNEENVSQHSNDLLHSGKDSIQLKELIEICTNLQNRVFDLENTNTAQAQEIDSLKRRVGLSARGDSTDEEQSLDKDDASKQGRIADIDTDAEITLVDETADNQGRIDDQDIFDTSVLDDKEVVAEKDVDDEEVNVAIKEVNAASITTTTAATTPIVSIDDITLAKALIEIKTSRPKVKGIVLQEPSETPAPIVSSQQPSQVKVQDKDEIGEDERLAREKNEANIAVIEQWHDVQAKIEADYELAQRMQEEEQEQLTDDEKARLFKQFLEKRRKFFEAKRVEEKKNIPPTKAQQRNLFNKAMKRVNMFMAMDTKLMEGSSKKAQEGSSKRERDELEQENAKKQKMEAENESAELKKCLEIIPDDGDDATIKATPLSSESPTIVDYKIYKEGRKNYFQIIRADGNSQVYYTFSKMLKNFNREDLKVL